MKFENRGPALREHTRRYPGQFNTLFLYEEMANINEGIAEILAALAQVGTRPQGGDGEAGSMRSTSDAVPEGDAP